MGDVLKALDAIRRAIDLGGNIQAFIVENVQLVLAALRAFLLRTGNPASPNDPFTTVGPIRTITPVVQIAANSALTAVITFAGFRMMWGRTTMRSQFVLRVLFPRLLLAAILINFAVPLIQAAVDASNALSDSVVLATKQQLLVEGSEFGTTAATGGLGLETVTLILLFAAYGVLAFAYVVRFALLVVLTILAPAAALLFVLPSTQRYAREWGGLFVSALLMQPLEQSHDFVSGRCVEVSSRFVRKQNGRIVHQSTCDSNTLPLTTRTLVRLMVHALLEVNGT